MVSKLIKKNELCKKITITWLTRQPHLEFVDINLYLLSLLGHHHGVSRSLELGKFSPPNHGERFRSTALQRTSPDTWLFVSRWLSWQYYFRPKAGVRFSYRCHCLSNDLYNSPLIELVKTPGRKKAASRKPKLMASKLGNPIPLSFEVCYRHLVVNYMPT